MSPPKDKVDLGGIEVTLSSLLYQAKVWDDQSRTIGDIASEADRVRYPSDIEGLFAPAITPYNEACDFISKLCYSGQSEMAKIAEGLRISHNLYRETEQQVDSQIKKLGL